MNELQQKLLAAFQIEHRDHLEVVRAMLEACDEKEGDHKEFDFPEAHRRMHSLKGAARAVDLVEIETLAHRLESAVLQLQGGELPFNRDTIAFFLSALDAIEDWVAALFSNQEQRPDIAALTSQISDLLEGKSQPEGPSPGEESTSEPMHAEASPSKPARGNGKGRDGNGYDSKEANGADVEEEKAGSSDTATAENQSPSQTSLKTVETVRLEVQKLDELLLCAGDVQTETLSQELLSQSVLKLCRDIEKLEQLIKDSSGRKGNGAALPTNIASKIHDMGKQARAIKIDQSNTTWRLKNAGKRLQQGVRQARMVPLESVFGDVRKICRNLASSQNKKIAIRCSGLEAVADRRILQELKDPVLHLLRNAINHGIEDPAVREKNGKRAEGLLEFRCDVASGFLYLTISDDGCGIDAERITTLAAEQGLVAPPEGQPLSDGELFNVLATPGFSTEEHLSTLAGRGIGMSIVQEALNRLQGTMDIETDPGIGTIFTLTVPASIASKRLLFVTSGKQSFCIPTQQVERILHIKPSDLQTLEGRMVFAPSEHANPLPIAPLRPLLEGQKNITLSKSKERLNLVILKAGKSKVAVIVDTCHRVEDCVVTDLGTATPANGLISGGVTLQDNSISLVLNPLRIVEFLQGNHLEIGLGSQKPKQRRPAKRTILIVDDSITTRTLEKSILEANGFNVRVSVDGLDALESLRHKPADLVVSDIEMPRMNGFGLLSALKAEEELSHIPVILVTSRNKEDDRKQGLDLGAEAYIVKQKFDQKELLETIRQVL